MTTFEGKSPARNKLPSLTLQFHVGDDGLVVAAGAADKPCFRPNFVGQRWRTLRPKLEADGWTLRELSIERRDA